MKHQVQHQLSEAEAKRVLARMLEKYHLRYAEYDFEFRWAQDQLAAMDCRIATLPVRGTVEVCADNFEVEIHLPLLFSAFGNRIRRDLDQEFERVLAEAS